MGWFSPPFAGKSFDTYGKAAKQVLNGYTNKFISCPALLSVGKLGSTENGGETKVLFAWHVMRLSYLMLYLT